MEVSKNEQSKDWARLRERKRRIKLSANINTLSIGNRRLAAHVLRGFRPDVSEVLRTLKERRSQPVFQQNTCDTEARICAMYVAEADYNLKRVAERLHVRRDKAKEFLGLWGVDWKRRALKAESQEDTCVQLAA